MKENKNFIAKLVIIPLFVGSIFMTRFFGHYEPPREQSKSYENYSFETVVIEPKAQSAEKININTASNEELCVLYGVGEKTAAAIINYREQNGDFQKTSELRAVKGIGDKKYLRIADNICVD